MSEAEREQVGPVCPDCGCRHFYTIKTLPIFGSRIRRRRECRYCGRRITTEEIFPSEPPKPKPEPVQTRHAKYGKSRKRHTPIP
jgi:DNA-directed RNA polymerase subunit RPC12/RpoP